MVGQEDGVGQHNGRLAGKVALVTGAGSRGDGIGNGRAASILMARQGAKVLLLDQVPEWVERTAQMIRDEGGTCETVLADVTKAADCEAAVGRAEQSWGRLDILVNNVGISGPKGTAVEVDPEEWDAAMRVNLTSMVLMAKYAVPAMARAGGGAIVNLASFAGLFGGYASLFYPTSKGAVLNLTRAMAVHHAPQGIRVNCVAPGAVYTPMVSTNGMSEAVRAARRDRAPLKVEGTGWDIGNGVLYLVSEEARWVTGVILPVDAGMSAAPAAGSYAMMQSMQGGAPG